MKGLLDRDGNPPAVLLFLPLGPGICLSICGIISWTMWSITEGNCALGVTYKNCHTAKITRLTIQ